MTIRALIIDDDPSVTKFLYKFLMSQGFEVFTVNSGAEGVEAVHHWQPDVVVLDLMMPNMSGWEVCRRIRAFSQVPILMLSAAIDSESVMRALEEGADDYMIKPIPQGVLAARLKRLARQGRINQSGASSKDFSL